MLQSVQGRGRCDAGLAHAATEQLADVPTLGDELACPDERRTNRCPQALAKTNRNAIEVPGPLRGGYSRGHDRVPQAGAIEVYEQSVAVRPGADRADFLQRINAATTTVVGILQTNQARAHQMFIVRANLVLELADIEDAIIAIDRPAHDSAEHGRTARF